MDRINQVILLGQIKAVSETGCMDKGGEAVLLGRHTGKDRGKNLEQIYELLQ